MARSSELSREIQPGRMAVNDSLAALKERVDITRAWGALDLPGLPSRTCRCPWREDHKPSFSVYASAEKWRDHASGDGGDVFDFVKEALGIGLKEAIEEVKKIAGGSRGTFAPIRKERRKQSDEDIRISKRSSWPDFKPPTGRELRQIADIRCIPLAAVEIAADRGLLRTCESREGPAWIVSDHRRRNAQARRLDGKPWERIGAKAWTLPGSEASQPIGVRESAKAEHLILVEGAPDLLAACSLIIDAGADGKICAMAMLGAGNRIPAGALVYFDRPTTIFAHGDGPGRAGAERWREQIVATGNLGVSVVDCGHLAIERSIPGNDLNDLISNGFTCRVREGVFA